MTGYIDNEIQCKGILAHEQASIRHILIVDDEENVLSALRRSLWQEHYSVCCATNGEDALKILARKPHHLIIADFAMPGMNGVELLRRVKAQHPEVVRIMLTGHAEINIVTAAVGEGEVYRFMLKPWDDDDLRAVIAGAFQDRNS